MCILLRAFRFSLLNNFPLIFITLTSVIQMERSTSLMTWKQTGLKMLSKVPKAYRMSNGYKVVPKIQANAVKYLSNFGVKRTIAVLVIGLAINTYNVVADFSIGKPVVAGLKYYFKTEKRTVKKYGYWGPNMTAEYINFSKRK